MTQCSRTENTNILAIFGKKEKTNPPFPKSSRSKRNKEIISKTFISEQEQKDLLKIFAGAKRSKKGYSKNVQKQN